MLLIRKAAKRIIVIALLLCALYGCYTFYLSGEPLEYQNNQDKMWVPSTWSLSSKIPTIVAFIQWKNEYYSKFHFRKIIENGISSRDNQNECHMPDLPLNAPEMMAFLKNEPPIHCDDVEAWVSCGNDRKVLDIFYWEV